MPDELPLPEPDEPGAPARETLEDNLAELHQMLAEMGELVVSAFHKASIALLDTRGRLAEHVIAEDPAIDDLRTRISALAGETIALFAPVATDLRTVVAIIQSAHDLERMGDLARHIAEAAHRRDPHPVFPELARPVFEQLNEVTTAIARKTATVLQTRNVLLAAELDQDDDEVDRLQRELFTLMFSPQWTDGVAAAVDVTLLARFYERFADHAVTIAKRTIFAVTGEHTLRV